jgi:hypothetical protein
MMVLCRSTPVLKENVGGEEDIDASRDFMLQMNEQNIKHDTRQAV